MINALQSYIPVFLSLVILKLGLGISVQCPEPKVIKSDASLHEWFPVKNIFSDMCEHSQQDGQYLLFGNAATNQEFVVDLGCYVTISSFILKNTNDAGSGNRGTRRFRVDISLDDERWSNTVLGELKNVKNFTNCDVPHQEFLVTHQSLTRYVKFVAIDYYGMGAGLQHFAWRVA